MGKNPTQARILPSDLKQNILNLKLISFPTVYSAQHYFKFKKGILSNSGTTVPKEEEDGFRSQELLLDKWI